MSKSKPLIFKMKILRTFKLSDVAVPRKSGALCMQILVRINLISIKKKKTDSNLYLRRESCIKTIHMHIKQQQNCFHTKMICILKSILTVTARKSFSFVYWFKKLNLHFVVMIFWVGGKSFIMKNENRIIFPESQHDN